MLAFVLLNMFISIELMCLCDIVWCVHCFLLFEFAYYMGCPALPCGLMTFRGGAGDQAHGPCVCGHGGIGLFHGIKPVPPTTRQERNTGVYYIE